MTSMSANCKITLGYKHVRWRAEVILSCCFHAKGIFTKYKTTLKPNIKK